MSAAILLLITLSQLMLTSSTSNLTEIINDVTLLKNELNTFMAQDGNRKERSASGEFVRPPKVVDTAIVKNKLHELQNNVTKLAEAISNKNQNVDDIKNRISSMEREIEELSKLYDDIDREIIQTLANIPFNLPDLLAKYKNQNVDDIKNRISTMEEQIEDLSKLYDDKDREITQTLAKFQSDLLAKYNNREQEIAKLEYEEFLEAIKHRYYKFAAVKFVTMKNETNAINWVERAYEEIGDLPPLVELAEKVDDMKRKLLIYKTIVNSSNFQHCLDCNIIITCHKMVHISYIIRGDETELLLLELDIINSLPMRANQFDCWRNSIETNREMVKNHVQRYCSSGHQLEPNKPARNYSGYCYPIDSIYSIFQ
ncbi:uncharacterized protein [Rhodnius prolixus]